MKLSLELLKDALKKEVKEHRYNHSLGVAETAKKLAEKFGADSFKAEVAGILHDFAKYWPKEKMVDIIKENKDLSDDLLNYNVELWHGPVASIIIQDKFGIDDQEIIDAIRYHTSGRENMSTFEKIICLADYIEPSRTFPGVEEIRSLAYQDLDLALLTAFDNTIQFLLTKRVKIYPLTVKARNDLIEKVNNQ